MSRRTGLSVDTLRFYEKVGLITPPPRDQAGHRDYGEDDLRWLGFLDKLNATGMKQADRIHFARLRLMGESTYAERRRMLETYHAEVQDQIARLQECQTLLAGKIETYRTLEKECSE
ncbi:MerR family transcriptional regulator [uncultured Roseovarius sp.]|uniref:MerR family transcriptional regulator n=1 Tax=uncultured Roseovarius sp. TaxID=293344 RepID=UPI0025944179|nr:MerR family transcriptional regulator [uncultured Roseovarius sp.]